MLAPVSCGLFDNCDGHILEFGTFMVGHSCNGNGHAKAKR